MHIGLFTKSTQRLDDFPSLIPLSAIICLYVKEKPDFVCDLGIIAVLWFLVKIVFGFRKKSCF